MKRDYRLLQQNQQIMIARAKEEIRDAKDKEILDLKHKMDQVGYCLVTTKNVSLYFTCTSRTMYV